MVAQLWLIAGVVLLAAEVISSELVLLVLGVAAVGAAGATCWAHRWRPGRPLVCMAATLLLAYLLHRLWVRSD
ncbi:hypothetical protein [Saccharopolyspora mangrovi]|uniref:Uncharacterized protein n=1 Tax=Saccharopolyspora mangrovi TaxID=3082379 RepID=A0ABU6AEW4_9PSEU|nr:hypothetical protein [Saccharopolyspora sp. S2-29]MEB3370007.1 hypothetical protein [Saccharopolyspora sp. S2-29]